METQRNNLQMKGKEEAPEKELSEIEASNLSNIEFKVMVIRMFKEIRTTRNFMVSRMNSVGTTST